MKKKTLLFIPSHFYLFLAFGCYYLCSLRKKYRIILAVNDDYFHHKKFNKILNFLSINDIIKIKNSDAYNNHKYYKKSITKILEKYKPDYIFQYNSEYLFNKYIFYLSNKILPNCKVIHYQTGTIRVVSDDEKFLDIERKKIFMTISKKYLLPVFLLSIAHKIYKKFNYLVNNIILPIIILNDFRHGFWNKNNFHKIFVFDDMVKDKLSKKLKSKNIITIKHPILDAPINFIKLLYKYKETDQIVFVPSTIGFLSLEEDKTVIDLWIKAINYLKFNYKGYKLILKFHPRSSKNIHLKKIKDYFIKNCAELIILDESNEIEPLLLDSRIIIGDFSSALWWATFFKDKFVISINFDQNYGSNEFSAYNNIIYFDNLDELLKCKLGEVKFNKVYEPRLNHNDLLMTLKNI